MFLDSYQEILDKLRSGVEKALGEELESSELSQSVSFCDMSFGDLATNIALQKAKKLGMNPRELAETIVQGLINGGDFASAEVAGPGFVNIRLLETDYSRLLTELKPGFFTSEKGAGRRVNVEFISANPTGPLVLVNAWGGYYGDILASLYASQGYEVAREYYLNDGGNQIAQLGRAVQQAAGAEFSEEEAAELYRGPYVDALAKDLSEEFAGTDGLISADPQNVGDKAQAIILAQFIKPTLQRLGIHHDEIYPESRLDNQATIERLRQAGAILEKDGAVWLSGEKAGLDKDEVLVRSTDGQETYFLKDISYQLTKLEDRRFDTAITIVGPDHHGQEQRLLAALSLLGHDGFVPLWTQTVRLTKDGQEYKMSKRRGNYIVLDEFLDMVPSQTARFFFAMRDTNSHFDMDLDLVASQNKHNPLFYVMYSYVRANSVLAKFGDVSMPNELHLDNEQKQILRTFIEISELIEQATVTQQVHSVLHRMIETARYFHDWYEKNPVIKEPNDEVRMGRAYFVLKYRDALASLFGLIGIEPQDKM
ncbi:MAG: Arginine--tRNA ligase [Patescibacteria group bacterium]|nr:Arginine--tRNA ligase [Patescibacteria group bacterium]